MYFQWLSVNNHYAKHTEKLRFMICFASLFKSANFVRLFQWF